MRTILVAELATSHGGDVSLAEDMIKAAADAGCDLVKLQTYSLARLKADDPQAGWLRKSYLDEAAHERLLRAGEEFGIEVFSTPFCTDSLAFLRHKLGLKRFKVASSESANGWYFPQMHEQWIISYPWGFIPDGTPRKHTALTAIPLYPTPLECVAAAQPLDGWSDHCEGIAACQWAIAQGAKMVEFHLCLPGRSRVKPWDKSPQQARQLREFADQVCTMTSGVSTIYRERWTA
jgi:N,N'-diacetyllegionaminate synthase